MRKVNFLPNIITAFGLSCGLFVIFRVTMMDSLTYEFMRQMTVILIIAGVADLLDGAVARAIKAESEFGVLFDSLSDAVTFGVAPSVLFLKSLPLALSTGVFSLFALAAAMVYTVCGILRLVRFNVKDKLSTVVDPTLKKTFIGVPIPSAAAAAVAPNLLIHSPLFQSWVPFSEEAGVLFVSISMIIIANLMVSRFRFPSLKSIHFRVPSFNLTFFTTISAILVIYGFLYYLPFLLIGVSWTYVCLGLTLSIARLIAGRKSRHLQDFEPTDEEEEEEEEAIKKLE